MELYTQSESVRAAVQHRVRGHDKVELKPRVG